MSLDIFHGSNTALASSEQFNEMKLKLACTQLGLKPTDMSIDELMTLAIQADTFARQCGPFDVAFMNFREQEISYMKLAELLERRDAYKHKLTVEQI